MTHKEYIEGLRELSHMIQTALALDGKAPIPSDVEGLPPVQAWDFGLAEDRHDFASRLLGTVRELYGKTVIDCCCSDLQITR